MQIEHIARIGLATGRTAQQQGQLSIRGGVFGEVIIDDQRMLRAVSEILAHGHARVWGEKLQRGRLARRG